MMGVYENVEVPFVMIGNRQALMDHQLMEQPWLFEFITPFSHCFERSDSMQCVFYYPEGVPPSE